MPHKPEDKAAADALRKALGKRIRAAREGVGWSQEGLAESIGVGTEMLSRYERGVKFPSHLTLIRLATVLRSSVDELLGFEPETTPTRASRDLLRALARLTQTQRTLVASMVRELGAERYGSKA